MVVAHANNTFALNEHYIRVRKEHGVEQMRIQVLKEESILIDVMDRDSVMAKGKTL